MGRHFSTAMKQHFVYQFVIYKIAAGKNGHEIRRNTNVMGEIRTLEAKRREGPDILR